MKGSPFTNPKPRIQRHTCIFSVSMKIFQNGILRQRLYLRKQQNLIPEGNEHDLNESMEALLRTPA